MRLRGLRAISVRHGWSLIGQVVQADDAGRELTDGDVEHVDSYSKLVFMPG